MTATDFLLVMSFQERRAEEVASIIQAISKGEVLQAADAVSFLQQFDHKTTAHPCRPFREAITGNRASEDE